MYYDPGTGDHVIVDGNIVERDALRVAEAITEYDPNLYILCVDLNKAEGLTEEPFILAEKCKDGVMRPIFKFWKLDDTILQRVQLADGQKFNGLKTLQEMEADVKRQNERRYEEWRGEAKDIVYHIAGMKSKYSVRDSNTGELITFFDDRPSTRK
jgi:hypothetical protein